jgi:hypothetical protein
MKTFSPHFDQFAIDRLRFELLKKVGWSISNKPDCAQLSDLIFQSGFGQISESTLYRLFFQFEKHSPYKNTLDLLCKFLGYKDSLDFTEKLIEYREELHHNGFFTQQPNKKSLLFSCIESRAKRPLLDFFKEVKEHSHQFKIDVTVSIFDCLLISTQQKWFFHNFAHQPYVREYFLEKGHDPKFRIPHYEYAYIAYLKGVNPVIDIRNLQDFIFGNCVLFRHYFISNKIKDASAISKSIYELNLPDEKIKNELYIFPYIRYKAYKLWYLEIKNTPVAEREAYASFLINLAMELKTQLPYMEQKIVLHTVAETFAQSSVSERFHWELKQAFADLYKFIHPIIYQKHLKYSLSYFNENGLLHYRP